LFVVHDRRTSRMAAALVWLAAEPGRTWPSGMGGRRDETTLGYLHGLALGNRHGHAPGDHALAGQDLAPLAESDLGRQPTTWPSGMTAA
jgi:hypothetical protein